MYAKMKENWNERERERVEGGRDWHMKKSEP